MQNASRFAQVGDEIPDFGVVAEIKDVGHESYFMLYTFTSGAQRMLQCVRVHPDGKVTYRESNGFGCD